jgi:protein-S-isoprenylcysteine O-methyltransferase Ste14
MSLSFVFNSQHLLNLLLGIVEMSLIYNDMRREEKNNIEKFGDYYLRYMEQVTRMNFVLGTIKLQRRMKQKEK